MSNVTLPRRRLQLTQKLQQQVSSPAEEQAEVIQRVTREKPLPLSFAQQRLWFLDQLDPDNSLYTLPLALRLAGPLQVPLLERSINALVERHETLRTVLTSDTGEPQQVIKPFAPVVLPVQDLQAQSPEEHETILQHIIKQECQRSFNLEHGPLFHFLLVQLAQEEHVCILSMHHSISDGWSIGIFTHELAELYTAYCQGRNPLLPPLPIQYADFAVWQRHWLQGARLEKQLAYWKTQLQSVRPLELPTDYPRPPRQSFRGSHVAIQLPSDLSTQIKQLSQKTGVTLFMSLLTAFKILLARYCRQTDIVVGTPIANRMRIELEGLIGFFTNTLVLRSNLTGNPSFIEVLKRVQSVTLDAYANQDTPFEKVVEQIQPERDLSRSPLFQIMFMLQNVPHHDISMMGLQVEPVPCPTTTAKFDLNFSITETAQGLLCVMEYATDLFEQQTIEQLLRYWQSLLAEIVRAPHLPIHYLALMSREEQQTLLETWNATACPLSQSLLPERFAIQVQRNPDAVALCYENQFLTYAELECRTNRLAHHLQRIGVEPEKVVGVCLPRGLNLLISVLGILKAGGAYLPLDPEYPRERLAFMLKDAGAQLVLTEQALQAMLPENSAELLFLDLALPPYPSSNIEQSPLILHDAQNAAYIIYTSGSTGTPKGVVVTHGGLINYLTWSAAYYAVEHGTGSAVHSSLSFDLTITGLFIPLLTGQKVVMVPEMPGVEGLTQCIRQEQQLSLLKLTPAHVKLLEASLSTEDLAHFAATLVIGGEALTGPTLQTWLEAAPCARYINEYGPTETVVGCCIHEVTAQNWQAGPIPIGHPIANTRLYVLDDYLQPVPRGVVGELYIAGAGVARGYTQRPAITAERFLPDPFSQQAGSRMYKSGDLARYSLDGTLHYFGRCDQQVKVRGYRIELGEIETALEQYPAVQTALVRVWNDPNGEQQLVAYLEEKPWVTESKEAQHIRAFLNTQLPTYMLPTRYLWLERFPLTLNGKVDRNAWPDPEQGLLERNAHYVAPQTSIEEELVDIWEELLHMSSIGIYDNFFHLGGHSLMGTQLVSRLRALFKIQLPLASLFTAPTIAELALVIEDLIIAEIEQMDEIEASQQLQQSLNG